jgi:hypothetical protein
MSKVIIPKWGASEPSSGYHYQMDTPFGRYTIAGRGEYGYGWKRPAYHPYMGFEAELADAKEAAEIDYENRVKSALI